MNKPPSFWKKASSFWIDGVLLVGAYLVLGYISEHIFLKEAYPPPRGMQFYSEREFAIYWFFVKSTLLLTSLYLFICYYFFGATLGQKISDIKLLNEKNEALNNKNIVVRILIILGIMLCLMIPGPIIAFLFISLGALFLNTALSITLLLSVVFYLFYVSFTRYEKGETRSFKDKWSRTMLVDTTPQKK